MNAGTAGCDLPPSPWYCTSVAQTSAGRRSSNPAPQGATRAAPGSRGSNRSRGSSPQNGLSPSVQAFLLSQDLSRDISHAKPRHLQSRTGRTSGNRRKTLAPNGKTRFAPAPSADPAGCPKGNKVLAVICSMKRAKARRHTGPARPHAYVETSRGLAKRKS